MGNPNWSQSDLIALKEDQLLRIANTFQECDDWKVSNRYTKRDKVYEVLSADKDLIVQVKFGNRHWEWPEDDWERTVVIYDEDLNEHVANEEQMFNITQIICHE